ncbi:transposase domain-containing protein [Bradyrhizobium sp. SSUT112]|nr:transposase domain-containing protein [Bradyrhizobium sp. SSUT112]MDH2356525.1 transposase domain-containing protein [Bradyrhizobium sp. SSUT112]
MVATCKLNDVNPATYIAETLRRSSTAIPIAESKT